MLGETLNECTPTRSGSDRIDVSVLIVTYNSARWITECLNSVLRQKGVRFEVIAVDNASADNTAEMLRALWPGVRVLESPENIGFGRGHNLGLAASRGRFIYMLNPDACLQQRQGLKQLCRVMEENPRWGLTGTRVTEADGTVECPPASCYPDQHRARRNFSRLPGKMAWVYGVSMFARREVLASIGGFDPGFFLGSEETDLCLRIRQAGWEIGFVSEVVVRHIGAASEQGMDPYDTWRRRVRGIYRFWLKHYPAADARRLVWKDWVRASFRKNWYGVIARLGVRGSEAWNKHRRYAGIQEAARQFLATPPTCVKQTAQPSGDVPEPTHCSP